MSAVAALHDIYGVIAKYSERLQDLQAFPWNRTGAFDDLIEDLEQLQAQIPDTELTPEENDLTDNSGWIFLSTRPISHEQVIYRFTDGDNIGFVNDIFVFRKLKTGSAVENDNNFQTNDMSNLVHHI